MVHLLMKDIEKLLNNRSNLRNIIIVGSTDESQEIINCLLSSSGIVVADNLPPYAPWVECNPREPCIEAASVSLHASIGDKADEDEHSNEFIINAILNDNQNVMHDMRIADGVIIVVDANQSINANMQTLIQNSIIEKLKIILFINNVDANLLTVAEANLDLIYHDLEETIEEIKTIIRHHTDDEFYSIDVMKNIIFGCAKDCWAFNLHSFADIYSKTLSKLDGKNLAEKLWADNFYSFVDKKWSRVKKNETYRQSFVRFVLEPMHKLYHAVSENNNAEIDRIISKLNVHLHDYEREKRGQKLLNKILRKWLPLSDCILPVIISQLPSPITAQTYRFDLIYQGTDETIIDSIKNSKENGKFFMLITKTLQTNDYGRRYAFGRIFSGNLKKTNKIQIKTNDGTFDKKKVEKVFFVSGRQVEEITNDAFFGSICALSGIQSYVNETATLTADLIE